ncbi:RlpA-like double-psi beta-barrel-protein domain-containing protein-containing protein [Cercophora newfieldiana]|uniref:RlpA-like double-psi beta-barrel-protein domain-containing protein-containing protein n=1 Tax=Cercophora newfieldiana TaxID=92897 RepID=A0AA40CTT0_9PEZI|nr:RlpA-like double-psi beta-barrel-protein domain-containing protein-containing protein [Cercophora newfieldiana]
MLFSILIFTTALFSGIALAAPTTPQDASVSAEIRFYDPSVGPGACGQTHQASEHIVALGYELFDAQAPGGNPNNNPLCGKKIRVSYGSKSVDVTITDRCPDANCKGNNLDLSQGAFEVLSPTTPGVISGTWEYI